MVREISKLLKNQNIIEKFLSSSLFNQLPNPNREQILKIKNEVGINEFKVIIAQGISISFKNDINGLINYTRELTNLITTTNTRINSSTITEIEQWNSFIDSKMISKINEISLEMLLKEGWKCFCLSQDIPYNIPYPDNIPSIIENIGSNLT